MCELGKALRDSPNKDLKENCVSILEGVYIFPHFGFFGGLGASVSAVLVV